MNAAALLIILTLNTLLMGCTRDYTPATSATGARIFQEACAECHKIVNKDMPDIFFILNTKNMNSTYVAYKVHTGAITMPRFPNIKGKKMRALSEYVLDHSLQK